MASTPTLHVSLTTARLRRGVLLVAKHRRPIAGPLGPTLLAVAEEQAQAATVGEARWLIAARDPAVVAVRRVEPHRASLWTAHGATASLASTTLEPPALAHVLAQLADAAARLHRQGLVHGALVAEHVLLRPVGPGLRPVLCSPAAGRVGEPPLEPADDVAALADLVATQAAAVTKRQTLWDEAVAELQRLAVGAGGAGMGAAAAALGELSRSLQRPPSATEWSARAQAAGAAWWDGLRPSA